MSELSFGQCNRSTVRWKLLSSVSAVALGTHMLSFVPAEAENSERPSVWIELGGQFESVNTTQEVFSPAFFTPQPSFTSFTPGMTQKPLDFSFGANGSISFRPEGSDWVFSAAIRYGRSNGNKHIHQSTPHPSRKYLSGHFVYSGHRYAKFVDATAKRSQNYGVVDFQAGKDVGLGLFGNRNESVLNFGVRIAQFHSTLRGTLGLDPDNGGYEYLPRGSGVALIPTVNAHDFYAKFSGVRSFQGVGPTLSWNASSPIAGHTDAEFTVDWGANVAVLFGRQKTSIHQQSVAYTHPFPVVYPNLIYRHTPPDTTRSRSATVPNFGGFAGASLRFPNARVSLGYRADWFFGAIDGGFDTRKSENIGFFGPFASVSVGLGG